MFFKQRLYNNQRRDDTLVAMPRFDLLLNTILYSIQWGYLTILGGNAVSFLHLNGRLLPKPDWVK